MTATQDLVAHPRAFLRHNMLMLGVGAMNPAPEQLRPDGTMRLKLVDVGDGYNLTRVRNRKGIPKLLNWINGTEQTKATNFYSVNPALATDPETFFAYVCPYAQDQSLSKQLGDAASLMFTAEMSGCSFGIGIPGPNGSVLVMHSNESLLATRESTAPQALGQLQRLTEGGATNKMLLPENYRRVDDDNFIDHRATTVGIRKGRKWEFWYQKFQAGGDRHMMAVMKIG